ncbi:MAG TPA: inositol monophosphatase family protein [Thermodesulfovibrionales bacterium]|nr:inositol monophosphatase family protein [Thermodesulfovibrionales bacterium]
MKAAKLGGEVVLRNLGKLSKGDIGLKQASDFVTRVDRESEAVIISVLHDRFPDHYFLAEESVHAPETDKYRWIIDPLDGTTNYIHQFPVFSISIALEFAGGIVVGVVYEPLRGDMYHAEKGKGAFLNSSPISVSSVQSMSDCLIATGFPFRRKEVTDRYLDLFRSIFLRISDIRRAGSAALDLAYLAGGRCDGFFEIGLSPWDIAAGSLLIEEAGGIVSDFSGGRDYLTTGNVVAGVPFVHEEILSEVKKVFAGIIDK